jgi:outer membrane protein TolC
MNKIVYLLLLISSATYGQVSSSYSLLEAQDYALNNHLSVKNANLDVTKAKHLTKEYLAIGLPQASINGTFNNFINLPVQVLDAKFFNPAAADGETISFRAGTKYNSSANLQVNQLIFNGSYFVGLEASKLLVKLQETFVSKSKEDVVFDVTQAYHLAAVAKESQRFVDSMVIITEKLVEKQKNYLELGMITQEDIDQISYSLLSAKNAQASAQIQYNNALILLKIAMFYPLDQPIDMKESATDLLAKASLKNTGNIAANTNLILLQQQVEIDALNLKNKKSAYLPSLGGYFQQSYNAFRNEFDFFSDKPWFSQTVWGLQLSIPVFSSGQRKAQVEQAKIVVLKDENTLKITENALKMQEIQAINNLLGAQQKMQLQQENIRLAGKIYDNSILKQQIGKENSINVTQKYNQLMIAQSQYVGSLVDVFQSKLTLDKLYNQILKK